MTNLLQSRLRQAASSTFEDLGFVFPDDELEDHQATAPFAWSAVVSFRGPVCGSLEIRVSDGVAEQLATNMLGLTGPPEGSLKRDALGEMANVVCGNVVPALGRPDDVFDLGAPDVQEIVDASSRPVEGSIDLAFGVEDGRAEVRLTVNDATAGVGS
jgi:CheY-specific phosphatase CheX